MNGLAASFRVTHDAEPAARVRRERALQKAYCEHLTTSGVQCREEVIVGRGRVDVLTDSRVIEMKASATRGALFQAIGQLMYYMQFFPGRTPEIVVPTYPGDQMIEVVSSLGIFLSVFEIPGSCDVAFDDLIETLMSYLGEMESGAERLNVLNHIIEGLEQFTNELQAQSAGDAQ